MLLSAPLKSKHLKWSSRNLTRGGWKKHCICKLTPSILRKHKLPREEEYAGVCCRFLNVCKVYPCPIYHSRSLLTAWKENIFIRAPSIINQCRVKSEYVSEELNKVETRSGFWGSLWEYQQCRAFSAQIWAERSMTFISLLCGLCSYKACNYT